MKQELLDEIVNLLNSDGTNYSIFLRFYEVPSTADGDARSYICEALGSGASVGGIDEIEVAEVKVEIENLILYAGDNGAGPDASILNSSKLAEMIASLKVELSQLASEAQKIERFWLNDGHPAYPVFWDFAFLFTGVDKATMFIGSSSD